MYKSAFLLFFFITGFSIIFCCCASTGVVPMDKGTYMIGKRDAQIGFGPPIAAQADVYREANTFCAKQNKNVETIKLELTDSGFGRPASASLHFRCVSDGQ